MKPVSHLPSLATTFSGLIEEKQQTFSRVLCRPCVLMYTSSIFLWLGNCCPRPLFSCIIFPDASMYFMPLWSIDGDNVSEVKLNAALQRQHRSNAAAAAALLLPQHQAGVAARVTQNLCGRARGRQLSQPCAPHSGQTPPLADAKAYRPSLRAVESAAAATACGCG